MMNKKIIIELYLPEDTEVNDINVGKALGEALMTNQLYYQEVDSEYLSTEEEE